MITWSELVRELVGLEEGVPELAWACEAIAAGAGERPRNIASIVGRSAAPNGVDKKSLGRSLCLSIRMFSSYE